ncbi:MULTISPECIES: AAA family ATPase [unclassified Chryseobacterium]|uniref:AAA family ATPase n=1 Tax=unclassified Chryseobacterium TaxID=2593645 RepID=UPI00100C3562|nr:MULTISPECIES: AAA family ATPase [unclassified Chryseobacterium]RXM50363.1 hypothetical protein BOQ64_18230 [Chryseobacterium sp. CH25]RXM64504.1 hypothetical protein BOQ60_09720 [Chryseobacterium sp. CH1]
MTKEITTNLIIEKQDQLKIIKEKINSLNSQDPVILEYLENLTSAENYLNKINTDLNEDIIPDTFYDKVNNTIVTLNTNDIIILLNSESQTINIENLKYYCTSNPLDSVDALITYKFYKDLDFFTENIVVVGANGSGKSTLADSLKSIINERDGIVISAQKLLIVPTFDNIPNFNNSTQEYNQYQNSYIDSKVTYNASRTDDIPYNETKKYSSEYKYVLKALMAERGYKRNVFCDNFQNGVNVNKNDLYSKLDTAIEIWNSLIEHREMFFSENNDIVIKDIVDNSQYPAYKMSDGEKIILFLIGRVLLANTNSMIIIDEPEMYLHKVIVNKLWDTLENLRQDCIFVYLTHDLDFASSRKAKKYWIKDFKYPTEWDIEIIPENDIPENLLMKLLGSRKKILFCEGKNNSLDIKIFEILFSNYTITPLSSCTDVINYVRSFNKIPNKNIEAIGFIDRDFRVQEQIDKFETENIFSYSVAEIENLFLIKDFVQKYAEYKKETIDLQELEDKVITLLERNKITQASNFLSSNINYKFSESHVKKGNSFDEAKSHLNTFINELNINEIYSERIVLLDKIITEKNYSEAILLYNNKGLLGVIEELLSLRTNTYRFKALEFLNLDEDAKTILKNALPNI